MSLQSKIDPESTETIKWWRRKNGVKKNKKITKIDNFLTNELGEAYARKNEPEVWVSPTKMGMDTIEASSDIGKYLVEFCSSSTIHGFNHLVAPHRHPFERFLTAVLIGVAFGSLVLLSVNFWDRFQNEATIFVLDRDFRHFNVTKPAVLLCPIIRVNEDLFPEVFKRHGIKDTMEARNFFIFLSNVTYLNMNETPKYNEVKPEKWLTIIWELKNDPKIHNLDDDTPGTWIVTERGICQLYFSTVSVYASYTYWMENNWTVVTQPETLASSTWKTHEISRSLTVTSDSVKVSAHHPQEVPEFEKIGMHSAQRHINGLEFTPQEIISSPDVKSLKPHQRKCKILSEKGLTMWPVYTRNMCILECKYGIIHKYCDCYPFFARPMPGIPVCGIKQHSCIAEHRSKFIKINSSVASSCGCYHNCDTSHFKEKRNKQTNLKMGSPNDTICNVFLEFPRQKVCRELLFGFNDFMASVGGAAGLFLGCSVISFVEVFYWATLRLFWYKVNLRKERNAKQKRRQSFYDKMLRGSNNDSNVSPQNLEVLSVFKNRHRIDNKSKRLNAFTIVD